jgi:hypothetical protein
VSERQRSLITTKGDHMEPGMKHRTFTACVIGVALAMLAGRTQMHDIVIGLFVNRYAFGLLV